MSFLRLFPCVLLGSLALPACSASQTSGGASDAGAADSSARPGDAATAPSSHRDPRCPAALPAAGATCDPTPAPLSCEYGGDAFGRCTTLADCSADTGPGPFTFHLIPQHDCGPNPADCPTSFGAVPEGGACSGYGLSCTYDEGVCGCLCGTGSLAWSCRSRSDVGSSVNVSPQPSPVPTCPARRPLIGDACPVDQQQCDYAAYCSPAVSVGPYSEQCVNGYWEVLPNNADCSLPACGD